MLRGFVPIRGCFAASMVALVWSLSSSVVLRALSDSEESVAALGAVMFSGGCFAAEEFLVDALPSKSSSLPADALLSRLLGRMLCRLEVIIYGYTSILATNVLSYFVLGSVAWGYHVEDPPPYVS